MTVTHIYSVKGIYTSMDYTLCGLTHQDIVEKEEFALSINNVDRPLGRNWCDTCWNHPTVQMYTLANTKL